MNHSPSTSLYTYRSDEHQTVARQDRAAFSHFRDLAHTPFNDETTGRDMMPWPSICAAVFLTTKKPAIRSRMFEKYRDSKVRGIEHP
jgi:hypothetical protein